MAEHERTNREWLADLRGPGRERALADLRVLLVRGLGYALSDWPGVTEADREDFAQEALLKIMDKLDTFRDESRFTTWAQRIAVHGAFSELRRQRWQNVSLQDVLAHSAGDLTLSGVLGDPAPSPERQAMRRQALERVLRLIDEALTERQRQAMVAVVLGGMPLQEVARRMDTNRNALYKLMHDARRRLKRCMEAEGVSLATLLETFEP
jgi:RNA polymerase sigma-70 factor (ECF subfamily)